MSKAIPKPVGRLPGAFEALVRLHPPRAIHDDVEYAAAQEMVDALTHLPRRTKGQDEYLDTLATLMHAFEAEVEPPYDADADPIDVLRHLLDETGMSASDLGRILGDRSLGPKILNRDRELSKAHIRALADHFAVPADVFL